jgi:hypothetical protein
LIIVFFQHLEILSTSNYSAIANSHALQFNRARTNFSVCYVLTGCLITTSQAVAPSASMLTSLLTGDCFTTNLTLLAMSYNNGGPSDSHASIRGVFLTTASNSDWSVCLRNLSRLLSGLTGFNLKVLLQPTVSQPVCLVVKSHLGPRTRFLMRKLRFCSCGAPPLKRGRSVFYNCHWHSPGQSLGPSPAGLMIMYNCLRFHTPQTCRDNPRIYIPQEHSRSVVRPGTGFHLRHLLRLAGLRWWYSNLPPRGSQSYFTTGSLPLIN